MAKTQENVNAEEFLTVKEVARRLRVEDSTVRSWIAVGAIEAVLLPHVGKRHVYRIPRSAVDSLFFHR